METSDDDLESRMKPKFKFQHSRKVSCAGCTVNDLVPEDDFFSHDSHYALSLEFQSPLNPAYSA